MKCYRCRWSNNSYGINNVGFFGNPKAELLFVGEAFGKTEAQDGKAFIGKAGDILIKLIKFIGHKREDVAIANAMSCYLDGNPTPTRKELDSCFVNFKKIVDDVKPKLVIALGASAIYQSTGLLESIEVLHGKTVFSDKIDCNVFITYHPAAILYDSKKWDIIVEDFRKINADTVCDKIKHYKYQLITSVEEFEQIYNNLLEADKLYVDVETTGLSPYEDEIILFQLSTVNEPIYLIYNRNNLINQLKRQLRFLLKTKRMIGQGWDFDAKILYEKLKIFPEIWEFDTCLAEYIISGMGANDLSSLVAKYAPESYGYDSKVKEVGGAHKIFDKDILFQYASDDVGVLPIIERKQRDILKENNQTWLFENITMPCQRVLTKMSIRGVRYDVNRLIEVDKKYEDLGKQSLSKALQLKAIVECEKHFGSKFNPRSNQMVHWLLLDYYKLPVLKKTSKGNPSIGKEEFKKYADNYNNPYCKYMEKYRSYEVIRSSFLSGVIPKLVDSVAHTNYSLHATETGRPNSKDPNLLNLPAEDKEIKSCIVGRPGYKFVYADLSQIEIRIASVLYDDENLIEVCNSEGDFHSRITTKTPLGNGLSYEDFYEKYKAGDSSTIIQRRKGKAVSFGVLYQEGPEKLAYSLGISVQEAIQLIEDFFKGFPDLKRNIELTKRFVIENGYVDTYFGFRRRWKFHSEEDHGTQREAVNTRVQGTAWQVAQLILIAVNKLVEQEYKDSHLVMQVYDSLLIESSEDEYKRLVSQIRTIIENITKPFDGLNRVKIKADIEIGNDLGGLEPYAIFS